MNKVAKAVTAALVTGYGLYEALSAGGINVDEWVRVLVFTALAGLAVWAVPNEPSEPTTSGGTK